LRIIGKNGEERDGRCGADHSGSLPVARDRKGGHGGAIKNRGPLDRSIQEPGKQNTTHSHTNQNSLETQNINDIQKLKPPVIRIKS